MMERSTLVRVSIFLATVVATWALLSLGLTGGELDLEVGQVATQDFDAKRPATVIDAAETERRQREARDLVAPPRESDPEVEATVTANVRAIFDDLQTLVIGDPPGEPSAVPELPPPETTETTSEEGSTTTTAAPPPAVLTGQVYLDVDGDEVFDPTNGEARADRGLGAVAVDIATHAGMATVNTDDQGTWSYEYPGGPAVVVVKANDPDIPRGFVINPEKAGELIECDPGDTCDASTVGLTVNVRPVTEVAAAITAKHGLDEENVLYLAEVAADDVIRAAVGEPLHLPTIRDEALDELALKFASQIEPEELNTVRVNVRNNPPQVFHLDTTGPDEQASEAIGEIVASNLQPNYLIDDAEWDRLQDAAAAGVDPVEAEYLAGQNIVQKNNVLTALHIAAIRQTAAPSVEGQPALGLLAVVMVLVALVGVYLATFRPEFWARPRMVALLGIIIVLAAASVRATVALEENFGWYVIPAVAFGFVTAVLFDQRIAILMALGVGVLTALGTLDTGVAVYAILAALAPIPFVSAVSTRGSFRNAVVLSSVVAAAVAASTSWFFHVAANEPTVEVIGVSVAWAFGVSVIASLIGLAALQFFESAFDVTTTLGLLDLTDRNHEALQMLQEKAFGTFNHSLMVGTLADAAARAIGANALLARAMAYYHDLGKTEHPTFFIENQFGMSNPHDELDPVESAQIIRNHVTAGVALARQYKIPTEVTEGIVSHHGDGVMRFFYERARQMHGEDVDIDDFRHVGHKPRTAESAILMLSDALEAGCRAVFQTEEPSPDAIEKVVDRIIDEKLEDGQLADSPLTLAELTRIRQAFLESLIGHYHQRIAYPNFPGS